MRMREGKGKGGGGIYETGRRMGDVNMMGRWMLGDGTMDRGREAEGESREVSLSSPLEAYDPILQ